MTNTFTLRIWPILTLAMPIAGVVAANFRTKIVFRFWTTWSIDAPVVVVFTLAAMLLVAAAEQEVLSQTGETQ